MTGDDRICLLLSDPLQVDKVNVTINLENWTFTAEVVTSRVFSSLSRYNMFIDEVNNDNYQVRTDV